MTSPFPSLTCCLRAIEISYNYPNLVSLSDYSVVAILNPILDPNGLLIHILVDL